jgi:SAM-dependent methyltransferase
LSDDLPQPAREPDYQAVTRTAYDTVAADYATLFADNLAHQPFDRAVLGLYAELVHATSTGGVGGTTRPRVADVGCGPGRITVHLASLNLNTYGIDLSPAMIDEARRRHPGLTFSVGSMTALDELIETPVDGLVAWYCVIHIPPSGHRAVYAGFRRALKPGGHLLLAFQCGHEKRNITDAYGHSGLRLDAYRLDPDRVEADLAATGFEHVARLSRAPIEARRTRRRTSSPARCPVGIPPGMNVCRIPRTGSGTHGARLARRRAGRRWAGVSRPR